MAAKINDIVKNLLEGMHSISHTETVIGEPTKVGDATVIPVHRLRVGFMAGALDAGGKATAGEGRTGGRGVGGSAQVDPVAVLAIGSDGRPRLLAVDGDSAGTWQRLLHDVPDLTSRVLRSLVDRVELAVAPPKPAAVEAEKPATTPLLEK